MDSFAHGGGRFSFIGSETRTVVTLSSLLFVAGAAFIASALNAAAGGGTFVSFPALLAQGVPPIPANATNSVAMLVGSLGTIGPFREHLNEPRATMVKLIAVTAAGGVAGAIVLLITPSRTFTFLIPFLLLGATVLLAFGPALTARLRGTPHHVRLDSARALAGQFAISFYGGYFGAAIGILMLALYSALGITGMRRANALKVVMAIFIQAVAIVPFIIARVVEPQAAAVMSAGALAGGYFGAHAVRRLPERALRSLVLALAFSMTAYFFWRTFGK